jgi:hypothetical protein
MLIQFLVRDEPRPGWQSGLMTWLGKRKPSFYAYMLPLAQVSRRGWRTTVWGQVRPAAEARRYRLQRYAYGRWVPVGPWSVANARGSFMRVVAVGRGTRLRVETLHAGAVSPVLTVR